MTARRNSKESKALDDLVRRLHTTGRYRSLHKNLEYVTGKYCGEFDVLGIRHNGTRVYYEYKCHHTPGRYNTAVIQFKRAAKAFPQYDWRFVYITPEMTRLVTIR